MNFQEFKNIITNDMLADENELKQFLNQALPKIPEPNSNVICNTVIERAVLVDKSYGEFDVSRLSYIPINIASQTFPHRGRFNNVGEPHFYGALSDVIDSARTRYYLATEIEQSILGEQTKSFNYTVA